MSLRASKIAFRLTHLRKISRRLTQWVWRLVQRLLKWRRFQLLAVIVGVFLLITLTFSLVKAYVAPTNQAERKDVVDLVVKALSTLSVVTGAYFALQQLVVNREGQYTDRFTKAISHLGDERLEVKLGGIYALERIARDSKKDHWAVMEVLTAYVRENALFKQKAKSNLISNFVSGDSSGQEESLRPNTDIQAILTVVGRRTQTQRNTEEDTLNLPFVDIRGAFLKEAHLEKAFLWGAHLEKASLWGAYLEGATLNRAHMEGATLIETHLEGAFLEEAHLEGAVLLAAHLERAFLQRAYLEKSQLLGAYLGEAFLHQANMEESSLQTADFTKAKLMKANLVRADLTMANLQEASLRNADLRWAQMEGANLQGADLSEASLTEGQLRNSILCNTILPDGTVSNRDCQKLNS